jgi:hypothetical protein
LQVKALAYQFRRHIRVYKPSPDWLHSGEGLFAEFIISAGFLYLIGGIAEPYLLKNGTPSRISILIPVRI